MLTSGSLARDALYQDESGYDDRARIEQENENLSESEDDSSIVV